MNPAGRHPLVCLFVVPWALRNVGGVSVAVSNLAREFNSRQGCRSLVLDTSFGCDRLCRVAGDDDIEQFRLTLRCPEDETRRLRVWLSFLWYLPATALRLAAFCRRHGVSVVNVHYPSLAVLNVLLARLLMPKCRFILSFHGLDYVNARRAGGLPAAIWRRVLTRAQAIVACSASAASDIASSWPAVAAKIHVVNNGVDPQRIVAGSRRGEKPEALRHCDYILSVGTLEHKKGHDVLIRAFDRVSAEFPRTSLAIMGRRSDAVDTLLELQGGIDARDRVHLFFDVPHDNVLATMAGAELFVLPSRFEPFGIVLLEAGLLGVPVVASAVGGITEIVDERSGTLVAPDKPAELADVIRAKLRNRTRSRELAAHFATRVARDFTWSRSVDRYLPFLDGGRSSEAAVPSSTTRH